MQRQKSLRAARATGCLLAAALVFAAGPATRAATPAAMPSAVPVTMQAIVLEGPPGSGTLQWRSVAVPRPGAGQLLIRARAAAVNPVDWKRQPPPTSGVAIPGYDVAGEVAALGPGVTGLRVGDAVVARAAGAYAQYVVAAADATVRKPARFSFEQAAGMPIAGMAGYRAADEARIRPGQRVAVIGAAGGAGSAAVEVAKARGARVIASGHSSQEAFLRELGVDEFVAYDRDDVAARVQGVDAVLNMVEGQATPAIAYVRRGGVLTSIAGDTDGARCAAAGITCVRIGGAEDRIPPYGETLRELAALADAGRYTVAVTRTFPLAEAAAAQRFARTGDVTGKIVLVVDPPAGEGIR